MVCEWVNDWYDPDYYSISPYSNPQGPDDGTDKLTRGGSWELLFEWLRVPYRSYFQPSNGVNFYSYAVGFRCAFSVEP